MFWEAHNYYLISLYPLLNVLHVSTPMSRLHELDSCKLTHNKLDERGMAHELPPCHIVGVNFGSRATASLYRPLRPPLAVVTIPFPSRFVCQVYPSSQTQSP